MNGDNQDSLGIGFGKWRIHATGLDTIALLIFTIFLSALVYVGWKNLYEDHQEMVKELRSMSYLLSLPQDARPELLPPADLWERMKSQTYEDLMREREMRRKQKEGS